MPKLISYELKEHCYDIHYPDGGNILGGGIDQEKFTKECEDLSIIKMKLELTPTENGNLQQEVYIYEKEDIQYCPPKIAMMRSNKLDSRPLIKNILKDFERTGDKNRLVDKIAEIMELAIIDEITILREGIRHSLHLTDPVRAKEIAKFYKKGYHDFLFMNLLEPYEDEELE